jgi:diamine N-acetyltransferase
MNAIEEMVQYLDQSAVSASNLCAMAQQAFSDTFAHLYEHDPFIEFLHNAYGPGGSIEHDLRDPLIYLESCGLGGISHWLCQSFTAYGSCTVLST